MVVLDDIKTQLGIGDDSFNDELLIHINSSILDLNQIGFDISIEITSTTTWEDINITIQEHAVKNLIFLKVKLIFDPPANSIIQKSYENKIKQLEFRLNVEVDIEEE